MTVYQKQGFSLYQSFASGWWWRAAKELSLTQVMYGCEVAAQGIPNTTVAVGAGGILIANAPVSVTAGNVTLTAADTDYDRLDAIVADNTGTLSSIDGPIQDNATVMPPDTTGYAVLAYVGVYSQASPFYTGNIASEQIEDRREFALRHLSPYRISGQWYTVWGAAGATAVPWSDGDMFLIPFFTAKAMAVQALGIRVGSPAATSGSKARLGIYADDGAGGLSLLVDAGQIAIDAGAASPTATITATLGPGWWWLAVALQSLGATKPSLYILPRTSPAASPVGATNIANASSGTGGCILFTGITGGLPSTPSSPDFSASSCPGVWVQAA